MLSAEIEAGRRMPPDLVETLRSIGVFRIFVPQSHGGLELDLPTALEIIGALSRIDGSVGWTAMIGGGCDMFAPLLPRDTYEQVYQNGPDVIIAGSAQPAGRPRRWLVAGGSTDGGRLPAAASMPTGCSDSAL
jgi:indole-3-acetate monooxygenase